MKRIGVCLLALSACLFGQGERGTFNGTVGDPSGAVIAGASVKAVHVVHPGGRNIITRLGTVGPLLPNVCGPMRHGHDLAVVKSHKFSETVNWKIRGVFTNAMNLALRNDPVTGLSNVVLRPDHRQERRSQRRAVNSHYLLNQHE